VSRFFANFITPKNKTYLLTQKAAYLIFVQERWTKKVGEIDTW
jgi:hypothetical protein